MNSLSAVCPGHITGLVDLFLDGGRVAGEEEKAIANKRNLVFHHTISDLKVQII